MKMLKSGERCLEFRLQVVFAVAKGKARLKPELQTPLSNCRCEIVELVCMS